MAEEIIYLLLRRGRGWASPQNLYAQECQLHPHQHGHVYRQPRYLHMGVSARPRPN